MVAPTAATLFRESSFIGLQSPKRCAKVATTEEKQ